MLSVPDTSARAGGTIDATTSGYLQSPGHPGNYVNDLDQTVTITAPEGSVSTTHLIKVDKMRQKGELYYTNVLK